METELNVRVQPRARRTEIVGERDGVLLTRVSAPPAEGRANAALCRLIAERVGVPPSQVTVVRGARSTRKRVRIRGASELEARRALGL